MLCVLSKSPRCAFWGFKLFRFKIQVRPNLKKGVLRGQKHKICLFLIQLIENQKLYNIFKNQFSKSITRSDMGFFPLFELKKVLFLSYLPSILSKEAEIRYVHLVGALEVPFGGLNFSVPYHPLTAPKKLFFGRVFSFFDSIPRTTPLPN